MGVSKTPSHSVDVLRLSSARVFDANKNEVTLGETWAKDKSTLLIFIRHFACIACRAHVQQVMDIKSKFENSPSKIIFIGHGTPGALSAFKDDMSLSNVEIYTDPSREAFAACSFKRNFKRLLNHKSAANMVNLALKGYKQTKYDPSKGIHRQMGGVVVISKNGKVLFHYLSEAVGDLPPEERVLEETSNLELSKAQKAAIEKGQRL